jgi:hypothetical protein
MSQFLFFFDELSVLGAARSALKIRRMSRFYGDDGGGDGEVGLVLDV